jgi:hypothetical protein
LLIFKFFDIFANSALNNRSRGLLAALFFSSSTSSPGKFLSCLKIHFFYLLMSLALLKKQMRLSGAKPLIYIYSAAGRLMANANVSLN